MVGVCFGQEKLFYIYTEDGTKFKNPNISQITDSTIYLGSHNISVPLEKIRKLLFVSPFEIGSLVPIGCMSALIVFGASYMLTPPANIGNSNLNLIADLINRTSTAVVLAPPITFGMFLISQVSRIKAMDMNEWSNDKKIKFLKQNKHINNV